MPVPLTVCVHAADVCRKEIRWGGRQEEEIRFFYFASPVPL